MPLAAAIPLVFLVLAAALLGSVVFNTRGFPLDDSWIHQVVGRNLAHHGVPSFALGGQSSGSTSALWPFVVAANHLLCPGVAPAPFLFLVNFAMLCGIVASLFFAAADDGLSWPEVAAVSAAAVAAGNFAWLAMAGMEHVAFVALILAGASFALFRPDLASLRRAICGGACLGLAVTTRIEALSLLPVFCLVMALQRRSPKALVAFCAPALVGVALALAFNLWTSGALMPTTFGGRKWLAFGPDGITWTASAGFLAEFLPTFDLSLYPFASLPIFLAITASVLFGLALAVRERRWRLLVLAGLALYLLAIYAVLMPTYGHTMRYVALPVLACAVFAAYGLVGAARLIGARLGLRSNVPAILGLAIFCLVGGHSLHAWAGIGRAGIEHIANTHVRMGQWLARRLPPGTTVASFDIGAIAWFSQQHVIDLGGLTDPAFAPYLLSGRSPEYLRQRDVRWLVLPSVRPSSTATVPCEDPFEIKLSLCDGHGLRKQQIVVFATPFEQWGRGFEQTGNAMQAQKLYRLEWD